MKKKQKCQSGRIFTKIGPRKFLNLVDGESEKVSKESRLYKKFLNNFDC